MKPEVTECSSCGAELAYYETRCPICGKPTVYYHHRRRCLHCGTPAAEKSITCMMCGRPVDSLPLDTSIFSGSWLGIGLGVVIIVGLVMLVNSYQTPHNEAARAARNASPVASPTPAIVLTPTSTGTPLPTATTTPTPTPTPRVHLVERGQTLYYIARQYGVSIEDIIAMNNIGDARTLRVGQELLIPYAPVPVDDNNDLPPQIVHVIKAGETLSGIAYEYGTPLEAIVAANPDINLDLIYEGQEIIVPLSTPTPTSTPTRLPTNTPTPGPTYTPPQLLGPIDGQVVTESTVLFNWTATGLLPRDGFYVLHLTWPDGSLAEHWTKSSSWRAAREQHPAGLITWTVTIMRQTGAHPDGSPSGVSLTGPGEQRAFEWQ